jgi:hypothetical protein
MQITHQQPSKYWQLTEVQSALMQALVYFDLFRYPLTTPEIIRFSPLAIDHLSEVEQALNELESAFIIFRFGNFWSLRNDHGLIDRRKNGNRHAAEVWEKAIKVSKLIHQFPFVRSVNISGSLSKDYFDQTTDFDFFIITSPGRIWLCRTLLALYKKIFLLNSRKYFCINYFITSDEPDIPDHNRFSATEIITLRNMTGPEFYTFFLQRNQWAFDYYPNADKQGDPSEPMKDAFLKRNLEKIFGGKLGEMLDTVGFRVTLAFWKRKFRHMHDDEFTVNLRSGKKVSKHHPQGFQFKVMKAFKERCEELEAKHTIQFYHG